MLSSHHSSDIHQIFRNSIYIYYIYIYYIYIYYIYILYILYIYISIYLLQMHCQAWLRVGQALGQISAACAAYALARGGFRHWILVAFAPVVELEFTICNCEVLNYVHSVLCTCNMIIIYIYVHVHMYTVYCISTCLHSYM